jgi:hypothetical protein
VHAVRRIAAERAHVDEPGAVDIRLEPAATRSCGVTEGKPAGRRGANAPVSETTEAADLHLYFRKQARVAVGP